MEARIMINRFVVVVLGFPMLAIIMLLGGAQVVNAAPAAAPSSVLATCSPGVPIEHCGAAAYVYSFAVSHNWSPPPGLAGNGPYRNSDGQLAAGGSYFEYRLYSTPGSMERLVIDKDNPAGNTWFTATHYSLGSFVQFYLLAD
jgi:hypothetical protein